MYLSNVKAGVDVIVTVNFDVKSPVYVALSNFGGGITCNCTYYVPIANTYAPGC